MYVTFNFRGETRTIVPNNYSNNNNLALIMLITDEYYGLTYSYD